NGRGLQGVTAGGAGAPLHHRPACKSAKYHSRRARRARIPAMELYGREPRGRASPPVVSLSGTHGPARRLRSRGSCHEHWRGSSKRQGCRSDHGRFALAALVSGALVATKKGPERPLFHIVDGV